MAKYMIQTSYDADGLKGLQKDKAAGRLAAAKAAVESVGGKFECLYWSMGEHDGLLIAELPDNATAASLAMAVSASGLVRTKTTVLLTAEELDKGLAKTVSYRAPGK